MNQKLDFFPSAILKWENVKHLSIWNKTYVEIFSGP